MRLYLLDGCPYAHRATIVLNEKKIGFEPIFFQQGKRPPELESVGPYAKSPTLLDGEVRVWDSQIVIHYLEERFPAPSLSPGTPAQRAQVRMLEACVARELEPKMGAAVVEILHKPERDEAKIAEACRDFVEALDAWDQRLAGRRFLVGDELSLADVTLFTVFPSMRRLAATEIPASRGHLRAWYDRMAARPTTSLVQPA
jgi:RNA polymerase-associated protein